MSTLGTILVIDDSATIRRLVDSTLSREGYNVILAPTAEEGLSLAAEQQPLMILLDHQLPGTTGLKVAEQLMASEQLRQIPVVASSTLRKQAYVEYADLPNVVDMLPKPYSEELLLTTVANALETGSLIVESQSQGTAVPEVIGEQGDSDFGGTFASFSVREVLDFLNNGRKSGMLEVEGTASRYAIYLDDGHVVGVSATGVRTEDVVDRLPTSLMELAPVLKVTMGPPSVALEGIVDLLNTEVLDPRLLKKLLRHQSAILLISCFGDQLKSFRFMNGTTVPPLFARLPLDVSVLALLVEGALSRSYEELPEVTPEARFARQPIRGQNLDRAGLSARQASVLSQLTSEKTLEDLVNATSIDEREITAVLYGLQLAELIKRTEIASDRTTEVIVYESDLEVAEKISQAFEGSDAYRVKVINDLTATRLFAKRTTPDVIVVDMSQVDALSELRAAIPDTGVVWVATSSDETETESASATLPRPYTAAMLIDSLDQIPELSNTTKTSHEQRQEGKLCTT